MKQRLKLIILIMSIGIIGLTCKKTVDEIPPSLTVNPPTKEVDANQGSFTINVTSTITWTANCDKSWVTIDPSQGEGNSTIKATYQANTSSSNRTASITVTGNGVADKIITITQLGIQPILTVTPTTISVPATAYNTTINITSNLSWSATSNQTWCSLAQSSGIGNASLNVNILASIVQSQRTAIITFSANGVTNQTVQITQAEFIPVLTVTQPNVTVNSAQGTANFIITSNIAWSATCSETWISIVNPSGVNNGTLSVNYQQNTSSNNRVATIILSASGGGVSNVSLILTQTNLIPTLSITPPNRDVTSVAGTTTFDIISNTTWTAQSDQTWCTVTNTTGTGNITLNINYEQNIAASQRIATISVTGNGLTIKTVTVTQQSSLPSQGLVAYYPFNGNANDESGNNFNATVYGASLTTDRKGNTNKAYNFNGSSDYLMVSNLQNSLLQMSNEITISCFINGNPTANTYSRILRFANLNGYILSWKQGNENSIQARFGALTISCVDVAGISNNSYIGAWYHICATYSKNTRLLKLYINGNLVSMINNCCYNFQYDETRLSIGGACGTEFFNGKIDDIRIYNRVISDTEIQQLYNE